MARVQSVAWPGKQIGDHSGNRDSVTTVKWKSHSWHLILKVWAENGVTR